MCVCLSAGRMVWFDVMRETHIGTFRTPAKKKTPAVLTSNKWNKEHSNSFIWRWGMRADSRNAIVCLLSVFIIIYVGIVLCLCLACVLDTESFNYCDASRPNSHTLRNRYHVRERSFVCVCVHVCATPTISCTHAQLFSTKAGSHRRKTIQHKKMSDKQGRGRQRQSVRNTSVNLTCQTNRYFAMLPMG